MTKLIVGLGNPDKEYENTRHNIGFMFVDYLAKKLETGGFEFNKKLDALVAKTKLGKSALVIAKPQTYVNKSGEAVKKLTANCKLETRNLIVVHDDLDIKFGNFKLSFGKNSGGHKGVESIMRTLKTKKFYRLRIGLGTRALAKARALSDSRRDEFVMKFVLSEFTKSENDKIKDLFKEAADRLSQIAS